VLGSDASAKQVASATAHPRVRYRVAPAEVSGLEAGSADLVTVAQALHWLDLPRFYAEVERVLKAGGVLAVWTYTSPHLDEPELDAVLQRFNHETVGPSWPPERRLVEEGYRTLPFPFPELETPEFQIEHHWNLTHLLGYVSSWSATQRFMAQHGVDPVSALAGELAQRWGDVEVPRRIWWPLPVRIGRCTACPKHS
jgi:SAM-dependent methyltransferase